MDLFTIFSTAVEVADSVANNGLSGLDNAVSALSGMTVAEVVKILTSYCIAFGFKILKVLFVWFIGRWITKRLISVAKMLMQKRKTNVTVQSFLTSLIDVVLLIILIVIKVEHSIIGGNGSFFQIERVKSFAVKQMIHKFFDIRCG